MAKVILICHGVEVILEDDGAKYSDMLASGKRALKELLAQPQRQQLGFTAGGHLYENRQDARWEDFEQPGA